MQFNNFPIGDVIIFDYRLVHRGVENVSASRRPLMYIVYAKSFWSDQINFGDRPLLKSAAERTNDRKRHSSFEENKTEQLRKTQGYKKQKIGGDDCVDSNYFKGYLDHHVHKKMLTDAVRMEAYEKAVRENSHFLKIKLLWILALEAVF